MEQREELQINQNRELTTIDNLQDELASVQQARDATLAEIDTASADRVERRAQLMAGLDSELAELYEHQRSSAGVGAGLLQGKRCGACQIELDRGELSRISAAADDDVLRCPECRAILLRVT
jgi:predicted  nucleic acid-binding Zn-ribbon protein